MRLSFQHTIAENRRATTYFAFCYPYSYSECQKKMAKLDERFRQQTGNVDIYYHRYMSCMVHIHMYGQEQNTSIPYTTVNNLASSPLWLLVVVRCAIVSPAIHPHGLGFTFSNWVPPNMIEIVSASLLGTVLCMLLPLGCDKLKNKVFLTTIVDNALANMLL